MLLGFSTNSLGDIDPLAALPLLRDLGYRSLAITLDRHCLDPFAADIATETVRWQAALAAHGMRCVIETGARHLLDPQIKHEPTLVSPDASGRAIRVDFLIRAIDVAARLDAGCVSLWSGVVRDAADEATVWERLVAGLRPVLDHAHGRGVVLGFEPEPGMFIDTLDRCRLLFDRLGRPAPLRLTVDVGHLECMGERPAARMLAACRERIVNVHIDDMLACRHEHLPLGDGDVDFASVLDGLQGLDDAVGLHVELPRQAHRWFETARGAALFLRRLLAERHAA